MKIKITETRLIRGNDYWNWANAMRATLNDRLRQEKGKLAIEGYILQAPELTVEDFNQLLMRGKMLIRADYGYTEEELLFEIISE